MEGTGRVMTLASCSSTPSEMQPSSISRIDCSFTQQPPAANSNKWHHHNNNSDLVNFNEGCDKSADSGGGGGATMKQRSHFCTVCDKSFNWRSNLKEHLASHTNYRPFNCRLCGKCFNRSGNLNRHMLSHTANKPFSCATCAKSFSRKCLLTAHEFRHTGARPFECDVCHAAFKQKAHMNDHRRGHFAEKFACDYCAKSYTRRWQLNAHMKVHTDETGVVPHTCAVCRAEFAYVCLKNAHVSAEHGDTANSFETDLPVNKTTAAGAERRYSCRCGVCGMQFGRLFQLEKHLAFHRKCDAWKRGVEFTEGEYVGKLTRREKYGNLHDKHARHACDVCGRRFHRPYRLRRHLATHRRTTAVDLTTAKFHDAGKITMANDSTVVYDSNDLESKGELSEIEDALLT
ncbi:uncharacterized protein LOC141909807 isoform X2 [Tubulanus polymorphus]|uniref:uncharacterized protein LOC141909807 isoform X2 n=1 Tax=Tubulanus polymorphus TaxID=672921 RepID=UPI003DA6169B